MTNTITSILGKKGKLTGAEVGNLVLKNTVYQFVNKSIQGIFSDTEIDTAVNSLTDNNEIRAYNKRTNIATFIHELCQKREYGDVLLSKTILALTNQIQQMMFACDIIGCKKVKELTYQEYEAYRKEKLEKYFKDNDRKITLFELSLREIRNAYDNDNKNIVKILEEYSGQPLSEKEKAFYGKEEQEIKTDDFKERFPTAKQLIQDGKIKDALLCMLDIKETTEKKKLDKSDFAYDLIAYWLESDQTEKTYKEIIKEYGKAVTLGFLYLIGELKDDKLEDLTINDLLKHSFTEKELFEKYNYNCLPEALESEPIIITDGFTRTAIREATTKVLYFLEHTNKNIYKEQLALFEAILVFMYNLNTLFDLLAEDTGVEEIKQLKYDTQRAEDTLQGIYSLLLDLAFKFEATENGELDILKEAFSNIQDSTIEMKKATKENIEKAKQLLRSSKRFKDYQIELFSLIIS